WGGGGALAVLWARLGRGLEQPLLGVGAASGVLLRPLPLDPVADLVARDHPQPAAERVAGLVVVKVRDPRRHRQEHFLDDVLGVARRQVMPTAPAVDQRAV